MQSTDVVPEMSCDHHESAVSQATPAVRGVEAVTVDLDSKRVELRGGRLDGAAIRAAINDAGHDVA